MQVDTTQCCVVGTGPGGLVLALLLARQGIDVLLLEAQRDFKREFRGDGVHPSTLELIDDLGLMDRLLALPHARGLDFPSTHLMAKSRRRFTVTRRRVFPSRSWRVRRIF